MMPTNPEKVLRHYLIFGQVPICDILKVHNDIFHNSNWLFLLITNVFLSGSGHVASYLLKQNEFRKAIYDCIDNYVNNYMQTN